MRKECQFCGRGYEIPGQEEIKHTTHGMCARCLLTEQFRREADEKGMSVFDLMEENNNELRKELGAAIQAEIENEKKGLKWEGESKIIVDEDLLKLYQSYERRARMSAERATEMGNNK